MTLISDKVRGLKGPLFIDQRMKIRIINVYVMNNIASTQVVLKTQKSEEKSSIVQFCLILIYLKYTTA